VAIGSFCPASGTHLPFSFDAFQVTYYQYRTFLTFIIIRLLHKLVVFLRLSYITYGRVRSCRI
jgi:hypothetical protein